VAQFATDLVILHVDTGQLFRGPRFAKLLKKILGKY